MKRILLRAWQAVVLLASLAPPLCAHAGDVQGPDDPTTVGTTSGAPAEAGYPAVLHGFWLPPDISCATIDIADSDVLTVIQHAQLNRYEDVHRFQAAKRIADTPPTWLIRSLWSIAGDPAHESADVFVLSGHSLTIAGEDSAVVYRKCR